MTTTATPDNWNVAMKMVGAAKLYSGVNIPSAGGRIVLHSDGSPDATLNTNVKHLGTTEKGTDFMVKGKLINFFSDEFQDPDISAMDEVECAISGGLLQILDLTILGELLTPGIGTYGTGAGYKELAIGRRALVYNSICAIAPQNSDPTKFVVFHLYSAMNDAGLVGQFGRKTQGVTPFAFRGYAIPSRAATDTTGKYWLQI
jgi:hypothetical protein